MALGIFNYTPFRVYSYQNGLTLKKTKNRTTYYDENIDLNALIKCNSNLFTVLAVNSYVSACISFWNSSFLLALRRLDVSRKIVFIYTHMI